MLKFFILLSFFITLAWAEDYIVSTEVKAEQAITLKLSNHPQKENPEALKSLYRKLGRRNDDREVTKQPTFKVSLKPLPGAVMVR